jgi:hypothetical protein
MKTSKLIAGLLVPAILSFAADLVQWSDLPQKIGHGKMRSDGREDREYRVVTKDGMIHKGYTLILRQREVQVGAAGLPIPREQVTEIRIHRNRLLWDALIAPSSAVLDPMCSSDSYCFPGPWTVLLLPVALGADAAAAPFILPMEAIKRLLPDKVFRVAP